MNELKTDDPAKLRAAGVIDLPTIQRYLNFHFSVTIDLFGADESSNAATFYSTGLKGRFEEGKRSDDHVLQGPDLQGAGGAGWPAGREGGADAQRAERGAARRLHQGLASAGVERWNKVIEKAGIPFRLKVPHKAFHRNIGALAGVKVSPDGRVVQRRRVERERRRSGCRATSDRAFVASLMGRVVEPGKFANWIAPPVMGINRQPVDFEYVRFN